MFNRARITSLGVNGYSGTDGFPITASHLGFQKGKIFDRLKLVFTQKQ